jgi:hypothetical protein
MPLLIRGFGVRVPGGARIMSLTSNFTFPGERSACGFRSAGCWYLIGRPVVRRPGLSSVFMCRATCDGVRSLGPRLHRRIFRFPAGSIPVRFCTDRVHGGPPELVLPSPCLSRHRHRMTPQPSSGRMPPARAPRSDVSALACSRSRRAGSRKALALIRGTRGDGSTAGGLPRKPTR